MRALLLHSRFNHHHGGKKEQKPTFACGFWDATSSFEASNVLLDSFFKSVDAIASDLLAVTG